MTPFSSRELGKPHRENRQRRTTFLGRAATSSRIGRGQSSTCSILRSVCFVLSGTPWRLLLVDMDYSPDVAQAPPPLGSRRRCPFVYIDDQSKGHFESRLVDFVSRQCIQRAGDAAPICPVTCALSVCRRGDEEMNSCGGFNPCCHSLRRCAHPPR